ncbi:hypothetical protein O6H91_02G144500 [Diphasiastrum complanatum]|uniref:Uncharacterized protein n=1 Tax=Diphasiastrum complanatum TaxID=34168 RepID=A0ACC2ELI9_DIPCM|nr:hypothetical protein O6H91_02G144500 [Diphasiastrum complanatum]
MARCVCCAAHLKCLNVFSKSTTTSFYTVPRVLVSTAISFDISNDNALADSTSPHPIYPRVVLKKGKANLFREGNPVVYGGAVDRVIGRPPPQTGDVVMVTDGTEKAIGWGMFNSVSMYRVRLMQMEDEIRRDASSSFNMERLIESRILAAMKLRQDLLRLPSSETDVYRLVNSEGDRLSGLIVDVFGGHAVVVSSAAWVERYQSKVERAIKHATGISCITWRPSVEILKEEGLQMEIPKTSGLMEFIQVVENGVKFMVSFEGQKTGFYADQRENRLLLRSCSKDKSVLDLCCYTGGFALNAAVGGATSITADGTTWDIVVLDPPKLAPTRKVLQRAAAKYRALNSLAMRLIKPGGLFMTCSCSGAVTQSGAFLSILKEAASSSKRRITQLRYAGAGADHPLDPAFPEGAYLTNVMLRVM